MNKCLSAALSGVVLMGLLTGCSSVMCGSRQAVSINSRPTGADVLVYDTNCKVVFQKSTPCVAKLLRANSNGDAGKYIVLLRKPGFAPVQIPLKGQVNDAYYANIIFGGVGLLVDEATGAKWTLTPEAIDADSTTTATGAFQQDDVLVSLKPHEGAGTDTLANFNWPGQQ